MPPPTVGFSKLADAAQKFSLWWQSMIDRLLKQIGKGKVTDRELIHLFGGVLAALKQRGIIRTSNVVGDLAESYAVEYYKRLPAKRRLTLLKTNSPDVDARDKMGLRYSIKGASQTTNKTSAFRLPEGAAARGARSPFDFVIIVRVNKSLRPTLVAQLTWKQFSRLKRWSDSWKAYSLPLTQDVLAAAEIIYKSPGPASGNG
jgi:hypothetical protein